MEVFGLDACSAGDCKYNLCLCYQGNNMKLILLSLMLSPQADANWFGRTCTFIFSKIAADDPYQYEEVSTDALLMYYEQSGIKGAWNRLESDEAVTMNIMGAELRWRTGPVMQQFELPQNIERIETDMELYQEFEGTALQTKDRK